jgi:hypothetical protein
MKTVNCVYSRNKLDFKKFSKNATFDDVISYHDIITKLIKNDNKSDKPSPLVVNSYIRKKIVKAVTDDNISTILYALKNLDIETVQHIKSLIQENYQGKLQFNLIVIKHKKNLLEIDSSFNEEFNKISYKDL